MLTSLTGTASKGSQASQLRAAAPAPMATVAGAVIFGAAIVLSPALASCSARDCAYYGSPDVNTRCVVISAPTTGRGQECSAASFGVSSTTDCYCAEPSPIRPPTQAVYRRKEAAALGVR